MGSPALGWSTCGKQHRLALLMLSATHSNQQRSDLLGSRPGTAAARVCAVAARRLVPITAPARLPQTATGAHNSGASPPADQQPAERPGMAPAPASGGPLRVWLLAPNVLGYVRLLLLLGAWAAAVPWQAPALAALLFTATIVLDAVDGPLARALGQVSEFGAWLDVTLDNATRALLWALALDGGGGGAAAATGGGGAGAALAAALRVPGLYLLPVLLEMSTFVATHRRGGAAWKEGCFKDAPGWVRWVMAAGFKTPQGTLVLAGLFGLPFWLWALRTFDAVQRLVPGEAQWLLTGVLACGRGMAAAVELWVLKRHLGDILAADAEALARARDKKVKGQ